MDTVSDNTALVSPAEKPSVAAPRSRSGFWALIATQFQGAFSDNILRNLLLSMIVGMNLAKGERETFVSVVTFLFSVPFLILSMPGGWLADRFNAPAREWPHSQTSCCCSCGLLHFADAAEAEASDHHGSKARCPSLQGKGTNRVASFSRQ